MHAESRRRTLKAELHRILDPHGAGCRRSRLVNYAILALILLNLLVLVLESVASLAAAYGRWFNAVEYFSVAVFSVEYLARLWSCTEEKRFRHPLWGRLRYALTPMALIDLLAILPFYLSLAAVNATVLRLFRLFRLLRMLKLVRYSKALATFGHVLWRKRADLLLMFFFLATLVLIAATLLYYAEREAQPAVFSSIPAAMWWAVATFSTVGYGDIYPVTALGKLMASLFAMIGIALFALPAGVLSAAFSEERARRMERREGRHCPHCGKSLH